ncbi:hypothetical protein FHETE_6156 [Fusarium heterosporum]|uniref:Uncharacterized protein n=1 Tax=Fusarium heterosporum TaxID=42747 RepID=A0A8H5TBL7_FUSHE|nr:hypothetical protein FHETE_6156 [Fusarium heterosporum]
MSSCNAQAETIEELDAKIVLLQNKLAKRGEQFTSLVAEVRKAQSNGMSEDEQRRYDQKMREASFSIRTIERRFDHVWDKKLNLRQLGGN